MKQMILKVEDDLIEIPKDLNLSWINSLLVGSRSYYNKMLILVLSDSGILELEDKFEELNLPWSVIAIEDEPLNIDEISPYMNDVPVFDEEGKQVDSIPFNDLSTIQTFSGHKWVI